MELLHASATLALADDEIEARKNWAMKMLDRAARGGIEENYRRVWLLTTLLENYFLLRSRRYPGPNEAFTILRRSDPEVHALFDKALESDAEHATLVALVERITAAAAIWR